MGNIKELFKKYTVLERVVLIILLGCFVGQFLWICYINLFQLQYHLGYDASSYLLKSIEMAKQGTPFISQWSEQTSLYLDSVVPFAALIYKVTNNIFLSFGVSNLLMLVVLLLLFWRLLSYFISRTNLVAKLFSIDLLISAYYLTGGDSTNDLSYSAMMYMAASMYIFKMIAVLMTILCVMRLEEGKRSYLLCALSLMMLFVTGLSSGTYMLFTLVVPCFAYVLVKVFLKNDWKRLKYITVIYLVMSVIAVIAGKICTSMVSDFVARDSAMTWCGALDFWKNLGLFVVAYPQGITAMTMVSGTEIMSLDGIFMMCGLGILFATAAALIYFVRKVVKEKGKDHNSLLLLTVIGVNVCMFVFGYTLYKDMDDFFQTRYLIPLMMLYFICIGIWMDRLDKRYIISNLILLAVAGCILGINIKSDVVYTRTRANYDELSELSEMIDKNTEAPVAYVLGDLTAARNLRVIDPDRVYKGLDEKGEFSHWGDYLYYDDPKEYPGEVIVINKNNALQNLESYYDACQLLTTYKGYEIYKMSRNIMGAYAPSFDPGKTYTFSGDKRTAEAAVEKGLSYNDGDFSWTDGNLKMNFYLKKTENLSQTATINFGVKGVWALKQNVKVKINGKLAVKTKLNPDSTVLQADFEVPEDRRIELELVLPDKSSPYEEGVNDDKRRLGLRMVDMRVDLK